MRKSGSRNMKKKKIMVLLSMISLTFAGLIHGLKTQANQRVKQQEQQQQKQLNQKHLLKNKKKRVKRKL